MLIRYQGSLSVPVVMRTARISCGRKSDRNWCIVLITCPCGSGVLRTGTEPTSRGPAAGKADTTGIGGFFLGVVVVVGDVVVSVVPVPPASARVGSRTA